MVVKTQRHRIRRCGLGMDPKGYMRRGGGCIDGGHLGLSLSFSPSLSLSLARSLSANHSFPVRKYRGTSLIRNHPPVGPYSSPMPRVLGGS